jgi:Domain of unknown function (DUF4349)
MRIRVVFAGLLQAGLLACGQAAGPVDAEKDEVAAQAAYRTAGNDAAKSSSALGLVAGARPDAAPASPEELPAHLNLPDPANAMVIRTGNASIEVDSLDAGLGALRQLARRVGGYVANSAIQGGKEQVRTATIEIKVPAERFEDLASGLEPLGKIEFVNVTAQDVGEEFVDLAARVANGRRLEERLIDLLATRTGKLQDVLTVERELARVREEIERVEGRMRYLKNRSAISSLSVSIHEPPPLVAKNPGHSVLGEAFLRAWRNFVDVLAGAIASLGYVVPVAIVLWTLVLVGKRLRRQPA